MELLENRAPKNSTIKSRSSHHHLRSTEDIKKEIPLPLVKNNSDVDWEWDFISHDMYFLRFKERKRKGGFAKERFWRMCPRSGSWGPGISIRAGKKKPINQTFVAENAPFWAPFLTKKSPRKCLCGSLFGVLSGVIRANRFARFARIGWLARIGNSSDSCESAWRAIKIGVSIANDSRESRCESPVPLSWRPFRGNEAHKLFSGGPKWGVLGGGQEVYVENVYVLFLFPDQKS